MLPVYFSSTRVTFVDELSYLHFRRGAVDDVSAANVRANERLSIAHVHNFLPPVGNLCVCVKSELFVEN